MSRAMLELQSEPEMHRRHLKLSALSFHRGTRLLRQGVK